jgi:hypothetical protein
MAKLVPVKTRSSPTGFLFQVEKKPAYKDSRRENVHPAFDFLQEYKLSDIDDLINVIDARVADEDEFVEVRQLANRLAKQVRGLGYYGALELIARVGYLLGCLNE